MRVLVFAETFGTVTKTFIYNEVVSLTPHAEVWVLTNYRGDSEPEKIGNVIVVPWNRNRITERFYFELWKRDIRFSLKNRKFRKKIDDIIEQIRPDIIHCHFANESIRFTDNFYHNDIPVLITFHGYDATQFDHLKIYRKKLHEMFSRRNIFPMFVSEHIRKRVAGLGVDVSKGFLLYLGINLDRFKRESYPDRHGELRFLQVSSFAPQKGHSYSVQAIRKFIDSKPAVKVKFIFGGAGDTELQQVKAQVRELNLEHEIIFTGSLSPNEVKQQMEHAHFFIHHSVTGPMGETEGLPVSIMEAMAMELPVLSTVHAGIPELVQHGINGILVNEKDIDAYVAGLHAIIDWHHLPANRERVIEMCEMKSHALKLMEIYKQLISRLSV